MKNRAIIFSESSLKFFMLQAGYKIVQEYLNEVPDGEDVIVLESMINCELDLLYRSLEMGGYFTDIPSEDD